MSSGVECTVIYRALFVETEDRWEEEAVQRGNDGLVMDEGWQWHTSTAGQSDNSRLWSIKSAYGHNIGAHLWMVAMHRKPTGHLQQRKGALAWFSGSQRSNDDDGSVHIVVNAGHPSSSTSSSFHQAREGDQNSLYVQVMISWRDRGGFTMWETYLKSERTKQKETEGNEDNVR